MKVLGIHPRTKFLIPVSTKQTIEGGSDDFSNEVPATHVTDYEFLVSGLVFIPTLAIMDI